MYMNPIKKFACKAKNPKLCTVSGGICVEYSAVIATLRTAFSVKHDYGLLTNLTTSVAIGFRP